MPFVEQKILIKKTDFCLSLVNFQERLFDDNLPLPSHVSSSVRKRRGEYYAGRLAAGSALSYLNFDKHVGTAQDRSPIWPNGSKGAITHTDSIAGAVVSSSINIGIDIEDIISDNVAVDIGCMVANRHEVNILPFSESESVTAIFSSKESIFKCLYPDVRRFFDFRDAELRSSTEVAENITKLTFILTSNLSELTPKGTELTVWCLLLSKSTVTLCVRSSDSSVSMEDEMISTLRKAESFLNS